MTDRATVPPVGKELLESRLCWGPQTSSQAGLPLPLPPSVPPAAWHHSAIKKENVTTSLFKLKLFNNSVAYIRKAVFLSVMYEPLS